MRATAEPQAALPAAPQPHLTRDGLEMLDACHRRMMDALDTLDALVARLDDQGDDVQARAMAAEVVAFFSGTARQHHLDEERHVFPRLMEAAAPEVVQVVRRLQQDHRWLEQDWFELSAHLQALADGQSWWDRALLREGSEVFIALLHDHLTLEESLIYPEARAHLSAGEREAIGREMAGGVGRETDPEPGRTMAARRRAGRATHGAAHDAARTT